MPKGHPEVENTLSTEPLKYETCMECNWVKLWGCNNNNSHSIDLRDSLIQTYLKSLKSCADQNELLREALVDKMQEIQRLRLEIEDKDKAIIELASFYK